MNLSPTKPCIRLADLRRYVSLWNRNQIGLRAAALTYTFILALVPAIAVCLTIFSFYYVDMARMQADLKTFLLKNLATGTGSAVTVYIESFLGKVRLKTIGVAGFTGLMLTSILLLTGIENSMNRIWNIQRNRPLWKRIGLALLFIILGPVCLGASVTASALLAKRSHLFLPSQIGSTLATTLLFFTLFKLLPNTKVRSSAAALSAFLAAACAELAKWGYTIYTAKMVFYNKVYGGLAALPFFLIWIYLNWTIFLAGTQLNYLLQTREEESSS